MSKKQRRDHKPEPLIQTPADLKGTFCVKCGDRVRYIYDRSRPVSKRRYWRHWRRAVP